MAQTINARFRLRIDTAANWASYNPVLLKGEVGIVSDSNPRTWKVGDGSTAWNSLVTNGRGNIASIKVNGVAVTPDSNLAVDLSIPTKTSQITNDSNFAVDVSYVHTDNNYTTTEKDKLAGVEAGAQVNVQADWSSQSGDSFIKNKPTDVSAFTNNVGYIVNTVSNLTNYYLKSETYTKTEVDSLISAIKQFTYEVVSTLPTASASTMYKIYLVKATGGESGDAYNEWITIQSGSTYSWENIGNTRIDLAEYRKSEAQDAIDATFALKTDVATLSQETDRIKQTLGAYTDRPDITLSAIDVNKAISKDGVKVNKTGWAIAEFTAVKGNEYLFKAGVTDGDVCIFAEKISKEETRSIDYTYTYDDNGRVATAKATYGGSTHSYTFTYELSEEGSVVSETITDDQTGLVIAALPYQYKTSVGSYQPMTILNASAELPADGYCRLVSHFQNDTALTVVVSYSIADADLTIKALRDGYTASICTQLSNLAKRIANVLDYTADVDEQSQQTRADVDGVIADMETPEDFYELPKMCGQPMILFGAGTPQESIVPTNWIQLADGGYNWNGLPSALGQQYINTSVTSGGHYTAVRNGEYELKWINS